MEKISVHEILFTKIIATLGPSSNTPEIIGELIHEGARAFRINFSHGSFDEYEKTLKNIKEAEVVTGIPVAVIGDLSGPKIRIGKVAGNGVLLKHGMKVIFTDEDLVTEPESEPVVFSTSFPGFIKEVKKGQKILLDDGNVMLRCVTPATNTERKLICEVVEGGLITSRKGVNLPDTELSVSAITPRDRECIAFAVRHKYNFLALSFVRRAEDLRELKEIMRAEGARPGKVLGDHPTGIDVSLLKGDYEGLIPIIAKIEKPQALDDLDNILKETDFVMIARGDLGVEMDLAEVAVHQKNIIQRCREYSVPVIVATQMLQSMIESPVPTRAEVSDVANAIYDGADAIMLSGETAVGKWPVEAVRMMKRIAEKTNDDMVRRSLEFPSPGKVIELKGRSAGIASGARMLARDSGAKLIANWTELGGSALFLSQQRMHLPVISFSHNLHTLRILALLYGIIPVRMNKPATKMEFIHTTVQVLSDDGLAAKGDTIVFVNRYPFDKVGLTNELTVHSIE